MSALSSIAILAPYAVLVLTFAALIALCAVPVVVLFLSRRVPPGDLPQTYLGISYMLSALAGWLPWGKTSAQPALPLPQPVEPSAEPEPHTVLLVRADQLARPGSRDPER
jgi:hypothetical protein